MGTGFFPKQAGAARGLSRWSIGICLLLLIGFWLRLSLYLGQVYHIDEFTSMLAATMVAQGGLPIMPSGLFYDHGLLLSYLSGAFVALFGFSEWVARWPVLLVSVFTIVAYYVTAQRLFGSRTTGLLAAVLATFDSFSIVWGVRARMYTLAHLFVLLSLALLLEGTLKRPSQRTRYLFLAFLAAALFSHTVAFLIVPPLAILIFVFTWVYRREWLRNLRLWPEISATLVVLVVVLVVVALGQTGSTVPLQDPNADAPAPLGLEFLRGFFFPGLEWFRFDNFVGFFEASAYRWLCFAIGISLLATCYRLLRRAATFADIAFLFLALFLPLVIFELGALLTENWHKSRYLFILVLPAFFLLSAESLARLLRWLAYLVSRLSWNSSRRKWVAAIMPLVGVVLVIAVWGPAAWDTAHAQGTGNYNTAFTFVRENWQPGDKVMTIQPAAAYLYLGQCDYYANQVSANVLEDTEDETLSFVDRYTGSPLIDTEEELNHVLANGGGRLWFVVDIFRLYSRFEPFFAQQVFAQMDVAYQAGEVLVFLSRPYPQPVPAEPSTIVNANFSDLIELGGYSIDLGTIAPDGSVQLGLYWRPLTGQFTKIYKVFVQLRNEQDQIVAQADHYVFEGFLTGSIMAQLRDQNQWLRDTADLILPQGLPSGTYRLLVGLYDPDTLERVPVVADRSGENAVILKTVSVP
jgi:4-amino-4-deoxy-L-arabinose transferase-like glycosyltransferase